MQWLRAGGLGGWGSSAAPLLLPPLLFPLQPSCPLFHFPYQPQLPNLCLYLTLPSVCLSLLTVSASSPFPLLSDAAWSLLLPRAQQIEMQLLLDHVATSALLIGQAGDVVTWSLCLGLNLAQTGANLHLTVMGAEWGVKAAEGKGRRVAGGCCGSDPGPDLGHSQSHSRHLWSPPNPPTLCTQI